MRNPFPPDIREDVRYGPFTLAAGLWVTGALFAGVLMFALLPLASLRMRAAVGAAPVLATAAVFLFDLPLWWRRIAGYLRRQRRGWTPRVGVLGQSPLWGEFATGERVVFVQVVPLPWEVRPEAERDASVSGWRNVLRLAAAAHLDVTVFAETVPDLREEEWARQERAAEWLGGGLREAVLARVGLHRGLGRSGAVTRVVHTVRLAGIGRDQDPVEVVRGLLPELERVGEASVIGPDLMGFVRPGEEPGSRRPAWITRPAEGAKTVMERAAGTLRRAPPGFAARAARLRRRFLERCGAVLRGAGPALSRRHPAGEAAAGPRTRPAAPKPQPASRPVPANPPVSEAGGGPALAALRRRDAAVVGVAWGRGVPAGVPERLALLLGGAALVQWRPRMIDAQVRREVLPAHPEAAAGALDVLRAAPGARLLILELGEAERAPVLLLERCDLVVVLAAEPRSGAALPAMVPSLVSRPPESWAEWSLLAARVSEMLEGGSGGRLVAPRNP